MNTEFKESRKTGEVLTYWLEKTGVRQNEFAEKIGVAQGTVSNMKRGARGITGENLDRICAALGISISEFFAMDAKDMPEIVFVERVTARPRAGTGGLETDSESNGMYAFQRAFIERKRGRAEGMKLFEVAGDSMSPTLNDGDMIMVNLDDTTVRSGCIYLLRMEDELMVKRLENRPGGVLLIRSDNPDYEDLQMNKVEGDADVQIFGRMVWSCREY